MVQYTCWKSNNVALLPQADWFLSSLEVLDLNSGVNTTFVCDKFIKNGVTPGIELLPWQPAAIKAFQDPHK